MTGASSVGCPSTLRSVRGNCLNLSAQETCTDGRASMFEDELGRIWLSCADENYQMSCATQREIVCTAAGNQHGYVCTLEGRPLCRIQCLGTGDMSRYRSQPPVSRPSRPITTLRIRRRRETSSDRRVGVVSPRGRSTAQQHRQTKGSNFNSDSPKLTKPSMRHLVQGHSGSVMALAVFEGTHEYVTAGYDRCGISTTIRHFLLVFDARAWSL